MTEAEKAYQYFVIAVPENEEQAKAYFWARKALQSTLTQPNEGAKDKNVPTNEPLTLEELREMDGEPVWVEELNCWALVDIFVIKGIEIPFALFDDGCIETFNISCKDLHCYRRPPVGEEEI